MVANEVHTSDIMPVRSRISWGAIAAGSVLALAGYLLLTLLGAAMGLSISDNVNDRSLAIGAVVWAIVGTAACLFFGGWIASQFTTGERKIEGAVYGLLVWGVVFASLLWLLASGVRAGFGAMVGMANSAGAVTQENWEASAQRMGYSQADIDRARTSLGNAPAEVRAANTAENRRVIEENATKAAWYSFAGTLISMLAAAAGGYLGAGPSFRLLTVRVQTDRIPERRSDFVKV